MENSFIVPMQIKTLENISGAVGGIQQGQESRNGISVFQGIFQEAVQNVKETEADLVNKQYLLATGQIDDAHSVLTASSEAQLAVDMLVSLRNKAMDSYNELMRISL